MSRWWVALAALGVVAACSGGGPTPGPAQGEARVSFASWPDLRADTPVQGGGEHDAAIVVGIEDYAFVADVPGAERNARDWYWFLTKTRQIPAERVKLLINAQGTHDRIQQAARDLAAQMGDKGTLWVVFIGHGAPSKDGKEGVLVGVDAQQDATGLYSRSLAQSALLKAMAGGGAGHVLILDACFSGRAPTGAPLVAGLQPLIPVQQQTWPSGKVGVLTAGASSEFAGPLPKADRPAFSYLVLGGLRGWADQDGDAAVSAREAVSYAKRVLAATLTGRTQTPEIGGSDPGLVLTRGAREKGPDIAAIMVGTRPVAADSSSAGPVDTVASVRAACKAGKAAACGELGRRTYHGEGVARNLKAGVDLMRGACDKGAGDACMALIDVLPRAAEDLLDKACEGGSARGCAAAARKREEVAGYEPDPVAVVSLWEKACEGGQAEACVAAAFRKRFTSEGQQTVEAADLLQRACAAGSSRGCLYLLVIRGKSKIVVDVDVGKMRSACERGDEHACVVVAVRPAILATNYEEASAKADVAEATMNTICTEAPLRDACALSWRDTATDLAKQMAGYCNEGDAEACTLLGDMAETNTKLVADAIGQGVLSSKPDAIRIGLYSRGCYRATADQWLTSLVRNTDLQRRACVRLADLDKEAKAAREIACALGETPLCAR